MSKCEHSVAQLFGSVLWKNIRDHKTNISRSSEINDISLRWNCITDIKRLLPEYDVDESTVKLMLTQTGDPRSFNKRLLPVLLVAVFPTAAISTSSVKDGDSIADLIILRLPSYVYDIIRLLLYIGYSYGHKNTLSASSASNSYNEPSVKAFSKHTHNVVARVLNAIAILNPDLWKELNEFYLDIRTTPSLAQFYEEIFLTGNNNITEFETMQPNIYINMAGLTTPGPGMYNFLPIIINNLNMVKEISAKILAELKAPVWSIITANIKDAETIRREQYMQQSTATIAALESILRASVVVTDQGEVLHIDCDNEHNNLQITSQNPNEIPRNHARPIVTKMTILDTRGESKEIVVLDDEVVQSLIMAIRDTNFINSGIYRVPNNTAIPTPVNNPVDNSTDMPPTPDRIVMGNIIGARSQRDNQMYIWRELAPGIAAWVPENTSPEIRENEEPQRIRGIAIADPEDNDPEDNDPDDDDSEYYEEYDNDNDDDDDNDNDEPEYTTEPATPNYAAGVIIETDRGYFAQDASGNMVFHPRI